MKNSLKSNVILILSLNTLKLVVDLFCSEPQFAFLIKTASTQLKFHMKPVLMFTDASVTCIDWLVNQRALC